jgi:hypothetical protein
MSDATDKRLRLADRLTRAGGVMLALFLVLYTAVILAFGSWQHRPLPAAWIGNLMEATTAMPLGALFWAGLIALAAGLILRARAASTGRDT